MPEEELSPFAQTIFEKRYAVSPDETWKGCAKRVSEFVANGDETLEKEFFDIIYTRKFIPGGRYLFASGREIDQISNCFMLRAEDSREGWADLLSKHVMILSTGGGIGTNYSNIRPKGSPIKKFSGTASGPISLMQMINEVARHVMAGGTRRSALLAGLSWKHKDIEDFINAKDWKTVVKALKESDFDFPAPLDMTNISVWLDDDFFSSVNNDEKIWNLYYRIVKKMCKTGEPGIKVNIGDHSNEDLTNPCNEVISADSGDVCNLGSINLSKISSINELKKVTRTAVRFLYLGTYKGWLPHQDFYNTKEKNRRIGLGLMGLHEWLLQRDLPYEPNGVLGKWLSAWQAISDDEVDKFSSHLRGPRPKGVRAIAPTGTTSIIGETTSGIEPIFCTAYKMRYLDQGKWSTVYKIDPTAERLISQGKDPESIEDTYSLAKKIEKRIQMQAFIQDFVDMSISVTLNIPEWGEEGNSNAKQFAKTLLTYLPRLKGITVYPENAVPGQPITKIKYETAKSKNDVVYTEEEERCKGGICSL